MVVKGGLRRTGGEVDGCRADKCDAGTQRMRSCAVRIVFKTHRAQQQQQTQSSRPKVSLILFIPFFLILSTVLSLRKDKVQRSTRLQGPHSLPSVFLSYSSHRRFLFFSSTPFHLKYISYLVECHSINSLFITISLLLLIILNP